MVSLLRLPLSLLLLPCALAAVGTPRTAYCAAAASGRWPVALPLGRY
jgi:hypothetical protein